MEMGQMQIDVVQDRRTAHHSVPCARRWSQTFPLSFRPSQKTDCFRELTACSAFERPDGKWTSGGPHDSSSFGASAPTTSHSQLEKEKMDPATLQGDSLAGAVLAQSQVLTPLVFQIPQENQDPFSDLASSSTSSASAKLQAELATHSGAFFQSKVF